LWPALLTALATLTAGTRAGAQEASAAADAEFAPGVVTTIEPSLDRADAISLHDLVEVRADESLKWTPVSNPETRTLYAMAKDAPFLLDVWCLEFAFKPLRMIEVDVPQPSGRVQRKRIWYMVYRVRNTGAGLAPEVQEDGSFTTTQQGTEPIRFLPQLVLVSQDQAPGDQRVRKAYLDRIIPAAMEPIRRREMGEGRLLNSVEMTSEELRIEAGRSQRGVWGVAMWEDVDPSIDFFSVYVGGLTNAHRWTDPAGAYKAGDPPGTGRVLTRKTLQLNFWRPGDEIDEDEREIRYGVAPGRADLYDSGEGVAHRWVYR
jgi:hypothetical protein